MEREELKGKVENDAADAGGSRERVCGCGCLPIVDLKAGCPEGPGKDGGR